MLWPEWQSFRDGVFEVAHTYVEEQGQHPLARQILFQMLGRDWVARYYPKERIEPQLLRPPYATPEVVESEAARLAVGLSKYVRPRIMSDGFSSAHRGYTEGLSKLLVSTLERESRLCHMDPLSSPAAVAGHGLSLLMTGRAFETKATKRRTPSALEEVLSGHNSRAGLQSRGSQSGLMKLLRAPSMRSMASAVSGASAAAAQSATVEEFTAPVDRHVLEFVRETLTGRITPATLRPVIWRNRLCSLKLVQQVRADLEAKLLAKDQDDAVVSPLHELLQKATRRAYSVQLAHLRTERIEALTVQVLNVYYTFCGDHSPNHVFLLYPLLRAFPDLDADDGLLVAMLHTLSTSCCQGMSSHRTGGDAALEVFNVLRVLDPELHSHIVKTVAVARLGDAARLMLKHGSIPPEELVMDALHAWDLVGAHLEAAFVGFLRIDATLFIWDQGMLANWPDTSVLVRAGVVVVMLLRDAILGCSTPRRMRHAITRGGRRLHTKDIREAYAKGVAAGVTAGGSGGHSAADRRGADLAVALGVSGGGTGSSFRVSMSSGVLPGTSEPTPREREEA